MRHHRESPPEWSGISTSPTYPCPADPAMTRKRGDAKFPVTAPPTTLPREAVHLAAPGLGWFGLRRAAGVQLILREPEMNPSEADREPEERVPARLLDVLIRAGQILALALLCYRVLAPFLVLMVWSLILAVALYPLQQAVARRIGERQGLAATLITVLGVVLIVAPTALLLISMGDSVQRL